MTRLRRTRSTLAILLLAACSSCGNDSVTQERALRDLGANEVVTISLDDPPPGAEVSLSRNLYFILDGSGSMGGGLDATCGGDQQFDDKLAGAKWAVEQFVDKVPDDVNLGLYVFDRDGRREALPLRAGNNREFLDEVGRIRSGGGTPLAASIEYGTERLVEQYRRQLGYGEYRLVVVTDGEAERIREASLYAARYGFPIYAIGLCVGADHPLQQYAVSYRAADNFDDMARGLEETLAELPEFDPTVFEAIEFD